MVMVLNNQSLIWLLLFCVNLLLLSLCANINHSNIANNPGASIV
jgi:hypothetical protein